MFRPEPPPRSKYIPPAWFVAQYNAAAPGRHATALDPQVMALWHTVSLRSSPSQLLVVTGC